MRVRNLAYWAAVAACLELAASELAGWLRFALAGDLKGPDFFTYYAISLLLLKRGPGAVYDYTVQKHFQDQVTAQWGGHFFLLPHILPPWVTLIFYPLGLLPYRPAYVTWGITILLLAALSISLLLSAGRLSGRRALLAAAAGAGWLPLYVLLLQGQSDAPMLAALSAAVLLWTRGRPAASGAMAALALFKPQLMLLLPALYLVRRSWRAVAAFSGGVVVLALLSVAVFGVAACLQWVRILAPWAFAGGGGFAVDTQSRYALRGLLQVLGLPLTVQLGILALGMLAVALLLLRSLADPRLQLALALTGSLALSPYQHAHDLSLLLVPGLLLAGALPVLHHPRLGGLVLLAGWLGGELLVFAPLATALAIVVAAVFLAWECASPRPLTVPV